jgi:transcriptional regulator with XRE-family HTH domain
MCQFRPAKKRAEVSVGESVRIIRELQGLSQNELARLISCGGRPANLVLLGVARDDRLRR